ncbi:zinc finger BED domain-containing protein RICESLEEPER 1-like [Setaria italica]|uniref:zinc finger BED domain-containing protein RICESLEEPER 1-like n=1 Tax=Setaria italica TaxID=4555 RepID=UPI000BE5FDD4|nr:zinc finger BED domain-containing protein RICESLEEPER 1-like [Setaria italica]
MLGIVAASSAVHAVAVGAVTPVVAFGLAVVMFAGVSMEALRDWNLDQKHFSLTSVNAIRRDEGTSKLMDLLIQRKCLPIRGELYNVACVDDVLNSIVSKGQPVLHHVGDILEKFIQVQMSSSLTRQQLLEVVTHIGLKCPQEDAKWWHKIYFRLEVFLHFKKAFPSEELLSAEDSKTVESVCRILRGFYRAVEVISGPVCPTANIYFNELWKVRTTLQEEASSDHTELANMVWVMQEAFNEYWQSSYLWLSIPVVLDPRFKITFVEFRLKRAFGTDAEKYVSAEADVRALGGCLRFWRTTCDADCVWEHLFRCRWPAAAAEVAVASRVQNSNLELYIFGASSINVSSCL